MTQRKKTYALDKFFPINTDALKNASEERIEHIDQFIYRFTRLQDSMGTRLLPTLYYWLENHNKPTPFLDILNRLEQLEAIPSAREWQFFRNLRHNLAHDYPESIDQTVTTLNILHEQWAKMEEMYQQVRNYYNSRKQ